MVEKKYSSRIVQVYGCNESLKGVAVGLAVVSVNSLVLGALNLIYEGQLDKGAASVILGVAGIGAALATHPRTKRHKSLSDKIAEEVAKEVETVCKDKKYGLSAKV